MARVGFHASQEQLAPSALLAAARHADEAGFDAVSGSDHFAPWGAAQGHSGLAWSWLGSALEATAATCGVVSAPVQRYHPAVIAQAIATSAEMHPGRFWAALGSGEARNAHLDRLHGHLDLGVDSLHLHHVGQAQEASIDAFAAKVLPGLPRDTDGGIGR